MEIKKVSLVNSDMSVAIDYTDANGQGHLLILGAENVVKNWHAVEQSVERTLLNQTLEMMSNDMHTVSSRPCQTCKFISNVLGQPYGCYKFQKRMP